MRKNLMGFAALFVTACGNEPTQTVLSEAVHPFIGCWESKNGLAREVWTVDPSGWLFGYALNRDEAGDVTFFEQMRIETKGDKAYFIVSAGTGNPVAFEQVQGGPDYVFENPDHDFPQRITYKPEPGFLNATISMIDDSNMALFEKRSCPK